MLGIVVPDISSRRSRRLLGTRGMVDERESYPLRVEDQWGNGGCPSVEVSGPVRDHGGRAEARPDVLWTGACQGIPEHVEAEDGWSSASDRRADRDRGEGSRMSNVLMTMYAVRRKDDGLFVAKNKSRIPDWTNELKDARVYSKPGPARGWVTFYARTSPEFGVLELVELRVTEAAAVQEDVRVKNVIDRKAKKKAERDARYAQWERDQAEKKLKEAQETLNRIGRKP
jgi:hypothetical protein